MRSCRPRKLAAVSLPLVAVLLTACLPWFRCGSVSTCFAHEPPSDLPSLREIGELHKTTRERIRSVSLELHYEWKVRNGAERVRIDRWRRAADKERITWNVETTNRLVPHMMHDVLIDHVKNQVSRLSYLGKTPRIPSLEIGKAGGVSGMIGPYVSKQWYNPALVRLGLRIQHLASGPSYTVDALCFREKGVTVEEWSAVHGRRCVRIHVALDREEETSGSGGTVDVYVDPTVGWLARKVTYEEEIKSQSRPSVRYRRELVVHKFYDAAGGVYFPIRVHRKQTYDASIADECMISVKDLKLNQPIPEKEFKLVFPKNLLVHRYDKVQRGSDPIRADVLLIGDGGKVVRTFPKDKPEEFSAFLEKHGLIPPKHARLPRKGAGS